MLNIFFLVYPNIKMLKVPLRRCSKVSDKQWCSADSFWSVLYCAVNSSSHLMNDGQEDKPCSKEFMKQVFPKFRRPGTSPTNRSLRVYTMKSRRTLRFFSSKCCVRYYNDVKIKLLLFIWYLHPVKTPKTPVRMAASCEVFTHRVVSETYATVKILKFLWKILLFLIGTDFHRHR